MVEIKNGLGQTTTIDDLLSMHCYSTQQAVDLLISFVKFQISLDPDKYIGYITTIAKQHDYEVEHVEDHILCQAR